MNSAEANAKAKRLEADAEAYRVLTELFDGMGGDRAPICREPLRRTRFGSCSAWLARRFERARLGITFIEEGTSIHDAALVQLAGACLDVSARTVGLGIQHRMPVLKRPHGRTHDLADGRVFALVDEGGRKIRPARA